MKRKHYFSVSFLIHSWSSKFHTVISREYHNFMWLRHQKCENHTHRRNMEGKQNDASVLCRFVPFICVTSKTWKQFLICNGKCYDKREKIRKNTIWPNNLNELGSESNPNAALLLWLNLSIGKNVQIFVCVKSFKFIFDTLHFSLCLPLSFIAFLHIPHCGLPIKSCFILKFLTVDGLI